MKVLVVEDEWLIAEVLQDALEEAGVTVCGPAARVSQAIDLIESEAPDAAVLDVNLRGETSFPVARALAERSIPFVFMTGYVSATVLGDFEGRPVLNKPVDGTKLVSCVKSLMPSSKR
jgi:DNA-binding response OmpR family regulator